MEKTVIDLGKSDVTAGMTFVCPRRAQQMADLMIKLMLFDRLSKFGDNFALRLRFVKKSVSNPVVSDICRQRRVQEGGGLSTFVVHCVKISSPRSERG